MGYTAAAWLGFGEALAAVAGALTGLLFVAVSIKSNLLARSRSLASRAAQTLVLFMIAVLTGLLLVAPQPRLALGAELLALALISGALLVVLDRRAGRDGGGAGHDSAGAGRAPGDRVARYVQQYSPNLVTTLLVAVAGVTLMLKAGGGLYWLIPAMTASLLGGVASAWLFLVKLTG
jgi:hypothetical protein